MYVIARVTRGLEARVTQGQVVPHITDPAAPRTVARAALAVVIQAVPNTRVPAVQLIAVPVAPGTTVRAAPHMTALVVLRTKGQVVLAMPVLEDRVIQGPAETENSVPQYVDESDCSDVPQHGVLTRPEKRPTPRAGGAEGRTAATTPHRDSTRATLASRPNVRGNPDPACYETLARLGLKYASVCARFATTTLIG
jgi:hypothetical protein